MRPLEILLLILATLALLAPLWRPLAATARDLPPFIGLAVLPIHWLVEGFRWQMAPTYLLLLFLATLTLVRRARGTTARRRPWLTAVALSPALLVAVALPLALPVPRLLSPTGVHAVGTRSYHLVDATREEVYTAAAGDQRELMVQLWYPARPGPDARRAPYIEHVDVVGPALLGQVSLPPFLLDHFNLFEIDAYDAPPIDDDGSYPLLIFSHGLGGYRGQNTTLVQELASHGYMVATIDHTYANAISVFPNGRVTYFEPSIFPSGGANPAEAGPLVEQWAADIGFVLDTLAGWQAAAAPDERGRLAAQVDLERVGVFGQSTGGGATIDFCRRDRRCRAGLVLDGWLLPLTEAVLRDPPSQPFLFLSAPKWLNDENRALGETLVGVLPAEAYALTVAGSEHFDFTDIPLLAPITRLLGLTGEIDRWRMAGIMNAYGVAFFDAYLRDTPAALLEEPSPAYPEVGYQRP